MPRRPSPRREPRLLAVAVGAACLTIATSSCGYLADRLSGPPEASPSRTPTATVTAPQPTAEPLRLGEAAARFAALRDRADIARVEVCRVIEESAVRSALDLDPVAPLPPARQVTPGDAVEVEVDGRSQSVPVAEFGCSWQRSPGPEADETPGLRAAGVRVFEPAVTTERATQLLQAARSQTGCDPLDALPEPDAPGVGSPGTALACGEDTLRYEGLVGDAWLVCELTRADLVGELGPAVLAPRLTAWCAHALERLDTSGG